MEDVFIGSEALAGGVLTRGQLRWNYRALFPDVYVRGGAVPSVAQRAVGAWLWSGRRAVVAGLAAAALHGVAQTLALCLAIIRDPGEWNPFSHFAVAISQLGCGEPFAQ